MPQKKILVTTTTFPRWKNDTTPTFVYDLSERLSSKYNVIVLAPHYIGAKKNERINNLEVRRFAYFKPESLQKLCYNGGIIPNMKSSLLALIQMPFLIISEFIFSYKIIKKENIDMIHAHWILPQGIVGVILKKIFKKPLLVTVHGSDLFPLKSKFFQALQKFVLKNMDHMTLNSKAAKNELIKRFPDCSQKIKVIPMGIDINLFKPRKLKKPFKYFKNKLLLFVGRLNEQKGVQYLIESMKDVAKSEHNAKLLIIGEGEYTNTLKELAINKSVDSNIEFLGPIPHRGLAYYYNIADIFVMPSLSNKIGTESLGLTLLEAMASGCAVVGTKVGGIPYIIKNGANGILVEQKDSKELANAIIFILKNQQKSRKMTRSAAEFARKNYTWEKVSRDFSDVYDRILK